MKYRKSIFIGKRDNGVEIEKLVKTINGVENVKINNEQLIVESTIELKENEILNLIDNLRNGYKIEEFYFDNIDCPNCANKVEMALNKSSLIIEANVVFLSNKIIVKHNEEEIFDEEELF